MLLSSARLAHILVLDYQNERQREDECALTNSHAARDSLMIHGSHEMHSYYRQKIGIDLWQQPMQMLAGAFVSSKELS